MSLPKRDTLTVDEVQLLSVITSNLAKANLRPETVKHFLAHKDEIPSALRQGFVPTFSIPHAGTAREEVLAA